MDVCAALATFGTSRLGIGFEACTSDCVGAALSDAALAVHAALCAGRVARVPGAGPMRRLLSSSLVVNSLWCATGAVVWAQPGFDRDPSRRSTAWHLLFRTSALSSAPLIYAWWLAIANVLQASATASRRVTNWVRALAAVHAATYALLMLRTRFEHYVLCSGASAVFPMSSMYLLLVWLCYRHDLLVPSRARTATAWPHPLILSSLVAGVAFGIGNSAIIAGRHVGVALWMRNAVEAVTGAHLRESYVEEMTAFHVWGLVGNELLTRGYVWLAEKEFEAAPGRARGDASQRWLYRALNK